MAKKDWDFMRRGQEYFNLRDAVHNFMFNDLNRVTLILTNRCNSNCEFCISKSERGTERDMETAVAMKVIHSMSSRYTKIRLTGGEPSLHKDFFKILREAARDALRVEVLSNGSFIPANPAEFSKKMRQLELQKPLIDGTYPKIDFYISADPAHFKTDKKLKDRIFLLANFLYKTDMSLREPHLHINVRGPYANDVRRELSDPRGVSKETLEAIGGKVPAPLEAYWIDIHPARSIVRAGGARQYKPPAWSDTTARDFDKLKEIRASFKTDEIAITPEGNAFVSVYSAYDNMLQPKYGKRHWLTYLGNVKKQEMSKIVESLIYRQRRFKHFDEFLNRQFPKDGWEDFLSKEGHKKLKTHYRIYKGNWLR
ncbi:MAG: radical SAM protein [Candidatus Diapherotrites archaeon]